MKKNLIEKFIVWMRDHEMTASEKATLRNALVHYATHHPVSSGLVSPYTFKNMGIVFASLVIVLGSSFGITQASQTALPSQKLYGIKIWVEEFQASIKDTPESKIAFETNRIKTRFNEASTLALQHRLDEATSEIIQSGLEHSRNTIRTVSETLETTNPELALRAFNALETSFSSNTKILAAIEKNTNQNIGTIVLAAQVSTQKIALEKVKFEKIVALAPNSTTETSTNEKLGEVIEKLKDYPSLEVAKVIPEPTTLAQEADSASTTALMSISASSDESVPSTALLVTTDEASELPTPAALLKQAQKKMDQGSFSEALVTLQKAEQIIDESTLTKKLEAVYNVTTTKE